MVIVTEDKVIVAYISNNDTKVMGFVKCKQEKLEIKKRKN